MKEFYEMDDDHALAHWGIFGMKWGVRRYQNKDGTLTAAGKKRYRKGGLYDMSDEDLSKKVNEMKKRRKLEDDYERLSRLPRNQAFAKAEKGLNAINEGAKNVNTVGTILNKIKNNNNNNNNNSNNNNNNSNNNSNNNGEKKDKTDIFAIAKEVDSITKKGGDASKILSNTEKIYDITNRPKQFDMSKMSNEELETVIKRLSLEEDYKKYTAEYAKRGKEKTRETIEMFGSLLAIGGSVIGIAQAIKKLKE